MKTLLPDQQLAVDFAYERDYSLLRLPTGFGKTIVGLTVARELLEEKILTRVLVLAPLRVAQSTWASEPTDWGLPFEVALALGNEKKRLNAFESSAPIVVMNYENVAWFVNTFGKDHGFDGLIFDELTRLKSVSGTQFKKLRHLYGSFQWRCGMAALSDNDGLIDLYGQIMMLDNGKALGRSKDAFLNRWFTPLDFERRVWEPKRGSAEEIAALIAPMVYAPDPSIYEASLPGLHKIYHGVEIPKKAYKDMERESVAEGVIGVNQAVVSGKLQQICAGFLYDGDEVVEIHHKKIDKLKEIVENWPGPHLISYWFNEELEALRALFPEAPVVGEECTLSLVARWNSGEVPIMLIHPRSGGHGLNIQYGGSSLIMMGPVWSNDLTHQLISRLHRRGQERKVTVHCIVAEDTIEDRLMVPRVEGKADDAALFTAYLMGLQ